MKVPNYEDAIVPESKITGYLLSVKHRDGRSKAEFFIQLGFSPAVEESWGQVYFVGMTSRMPLKSVWKKAGGVGP